MTYYDEIYNRIKKKKKHFKYLILFNKNFVDIRIICIHHPTI